MTDTYPPVDRKDFAHLVRDFFAFIRSILVFLIESIRNFWWLFLLVLIAVTFYGYSRNSGKEPLYRADFTLVFNNLHQKVYGEMIQRLNVLAMTGSHRQFAKELNLSEELATSVRSVEARNSSGSFMHEDLSDSKLPIYVTATVSNRDVLLPLQESIIHYLNNAIPYQKQKRELDSTLLREKIAFLASSISQVDQAINARLNQPAALIAERDTSVRRSDIVGLISLKEELMNRMQADIKLAEMQESVVLLYGVAPTEYPNMNHAVPWFKLLMIGLLLAMAASALANMLTLGQKV